MVSVFDFDVFRRPPPDLHERGTLSGSILSLASLVAVLIILTWHFVFYMFIPIRSTELTVKQFRKDRVKIHLILDVAMPCPLIDLEVHDAMGKHTVDAARNIKKQRLEANGQGVVEGREVVTGADGNAVRVSLQHDHIKNSGSGKAVHVNYFEMEGRDQLDSLGKEGMSAVGVMADAKEWCRFNGTLVVAKIPGKLFLRAHHAHLGKILGKEKVQGSWYNTTHVFRSMHILDLDHGHDDLDHLKLADSSPFSPELFMMQSSVMGLLQVFGMRFATSPMTLTSRTMSVARTNWRYDLQVVEVTLATGTETYEYTMGYYSYQMLESAFENAAELVEPLSVSYSFSPITVVHKKTYQSFFEFARSLLSTLGGGFAILKILDNSIYLGRHISVKQREGKHY